MIKHVIFGYEGVIANIDKNVFIKKIMQYSPHGAPALRRIIYRENKHLIDAHKTGWLNSGDLYNAIRNAAELRQGEICPSIFKNAYTDVFTVIEETAELIHHLHDNGIMLGLIINTGQLEYEYSIQTQEICREFSYIVKSCDSDVKLMKPNTRIYGNMMQKLRVNPDDCIYVDRLKKNITGGKRAKLPGILFESAVDTARKLVELGVIDTLPPSFLPKPEMVVTMDELVLVDMSPEVPKEQPRGLSKRRFG